MQVEGVDEVGRWRKEISKGSLRLGVLALLQEAEGYGYQILATLREQGAIQATEAAVYPLLKDLERRGHLKSRWDAPEPGLPPRKYYALTAEGALLLDALRGAWAEFRDGIDRLLERSQ